MPFSNQFLEQTFFFPFVFVFVFSLLTVLVSVLILPIWFSGYSSFSWIRWDDDVVFKNQDRGETKTPKRFINDTIRNDFHRKFLHKYMKQLKGRELVFISPLFHVPRLEIDHVTRYKIISNAVLKQNCFSRSVYPNYCQNYKASVFFTFNQTSVEDQKF